jgi:glycosyltransferase involved in cell wall biosynthesis
VDTNAIEPRVLSARSQVTIGWIGSWSTTESLLSIAGTLRKAAEAFGVRLLFVGSFDLDRVRTAIPEAEWRTWRADRERDDLAEFDIGIMPLADTPWNRGKGAFKVIQYMAAGIPFVASPVGMNVSVARDSGAGLLCADEAAWIEALGRLALDPDLRSELGAAGRRHACMTYDHRLYAHAIADLFEMGGSGT